MEVLKGTFEKGIEGLASSFSSGISGLKNSFTENLAALKSGFDFALELLGSKFTSAIDNVVSAVTGFFENFYILLQDMLKFLFIPEEGYFDAQVNLIVRKFDFADSIIDTAQVFVNFIETNDFGKAPVITLDLSNSTGKYNYGLSAFFLDMSWYAPYKKPVDVILSGLMWIVFIWNCFKDLPGIINGVGTAGASSAKIVRYEEGEL